MSVLHPWAQGPFELIIHAEEHLRQGDDFDRRIALISFDNAVEVAVSTYLSLHPVQRGGKEYQKADVDKWMKDYHTKLSFIEQELTTRGLPWDVEKTHIIWAHNYRNDQYHGGTKGTPEKQVLEIIRKAALWIMSVLYNIADVEKILNDTIAAKLPAPSPKPDINFDRAIDGFYGMVDVAGQSYYTSELLFAVDDLAYRDIGLDLTTKQPEGETDQ